MSIEFKIADRRDFDSIVEMMADYYECDHLDFDNVRALKTVAQLIETPVLGRIWLIKNAMKKTIGYIVMMNLFSLEFGGQVGLIDELFVSNEFRGRGIGSAAINYVLNDAKINGLQSVRLEVTKSNDQALKLYRKLGFEDLGRSLLNFSIQR